MRTVDVLVVGIGFAGATCARILADAGYRIHLVERRAHIGGNAYDALDAAGVLVHPYGPHIFHTASDRILAFLSRFTDWRPYEHRVLAQIGDQLLPIPINRTTISRLYGVDLDEAGAISHFTRVREHRKPLVTSEDVVLSLVGRDLCDKFYRGYTRKHWGLDLRDLPARVAARIPVRTNADDRYFRDRHQCMPADGYTAMFRRMLDHTLISHETGVDFADVRDNIRHRHLIYTGPIDAYFDFRFGRLPYRSVHFQHEHLPGVRQFQSVGTINYPNHHAYTRVTEFKHLTGQVHGGTSIVREYPRAQGEPFYPIPGRENERLLRRYRFFARQYPSITFVGRLAQYRYYDMDQVVGAAITAARRVAGLLTAPQPAM